MTDQQRLVSFVPVGSKFCIDPERNRQVGRAVHQLDHPVADTINLVVPPAMLTKSDKLKRGQAAKALLEVRRDLGSVATVQHFSALSRQGEEEARVKLDEFLSAIK